MHSRQTGEKTPTKVLIWPYVVSLWSQPLTVWP